MLQYVLLLLIPTLTVAATYEEDARSLFNSFDMDGNKKLTRAEVVIGFTLYDSDHDGRITHEEYRHFFDLLVPHFSPIADHLFDHFDVDGDSHLQMHDFDQLLKMMDTNSNGDVSEAEFVRYWTVLFESLDHHFPA